MIADLLELLDRQRTFLDRQHDVRFVLHLRRYFALLDADARVRVLLDDLHAEAYAALDAFSAHQQTVAHRLRPLREQLEAAGDPLEPQRSPGDAQYLSFEHWDSRYASLLDSAPPPQPGTENVSVVDILLHILQRRLHRIRFEVPEHSGRVIHETGDDRRPELAKLAGSVAEIAGEHQRVQQRLTDDTAVLAPFALLRLRGIVEALDVSPPRARAVGDEEPIDWVTALVRQRFGALAALVVKEAPERGRPVRGLVPDAADRLSELVAAAKDELDVVHEEIRLRLGLTRSRLALIHRFKQRCEWYEHNSLRAIAERRSSTAEAALTRELVRFLFDQGLNPITRPLTGRLEPDLLDPALTPSFYVEVKQYVRSARQYLREGVWQVHDTMATLAATRYEVRDAFYVVFRRGGPRYSFPAEVRGERWRIYPVLIDLAPNVGSRGGGQAKTIPADELEPSAD
ncbi:MAG: hypothetical protein M3134_12135 [Actinomycetota bacterium]|nr:hypothetical protein [Actinomycetota bacterium]